MESGYRPKGKGDPAKSKPPTSGTGVRAPDCQGCNAKGTCGVMVNRVLEPASPAEAEARANCMIWQGAFPICVGDLVCKRDEVMAVYYRVVRMPGKPEPGYVWIHNADPALSAKEAKAEKVKLEDLEHARASDQRDP